MLRVRAHAPVAVFVAISADQMVAVAPVLGFDATWENIMVRLLRGVNISVVSGDNAVFLLFGVGIVPDPLHTVILLIETHNVPIADLRLIVIHWDSIPMAPLDGHLRILPGGVALGLLGLLLCLEHWVVVIGVLFELRRVHAMWAALWLVAARVGHVRSSKTNYIPIDPLGNIFIVKT